MTAEVYTWENTLPEISWKVRNTYELGYIVLVSLSLKCQILKLDGKMKTLTPGGDTVGTPLGKIRRDSSKTFCWH